MEQILEEIFAQPEALQSLRQAYFHEQGLKRFADIPAGALEGMVGMGASLHAALQAQYHLRSLGVDAQAIEAVDLIYSSAWLARRGALTYLSQSGESGEIRPVLENLPRNLPLVGITNHPESQLGQHADVLLPLYAGDETLVASKTYVNTLALLWLLARKLYGAWSGTEEEALAKVAAAAQTILEQASTAVALWTDALAQQSRRIFVGQGAYGVTARQASMMVAEWAKEVTLSWTSGSFRHGFIELVQPDTGVVIFTGGTGDMLKSALALAEELEDYGAQVLLVQRGVTLRRKDFHTQNGEIDEFLAPILDILPAQLFAVEMAHRMHVAPSFRHIAKVVKRL